MTIYYKHDFTTRKYLDTPINLYNNIKSNKITMAYEILSPPMRAYMDLDGISNTDCRYDEFIKLYNKLDKCDYNVIIFDGSRKVSDTEYKISFHVIFLNTIFTSFAKVKEFVMSNCSSINESAVINIDESVYKPNQLMRMPYTIKTVNDDMLQKVNVGGSLTSGFLEYYKMDLNHVNEYVISLPKDKNVCPKPIYQRKYSSMSKIQSMRKIQRPILSRKIYNPKNTLVINELLDLVNAFANYSFRSYTAAVEFIREHISDIISYILTMDSYVVKVDGKYMEMAALPYLKVVYYEKGKLVMENLYAIGNREMLFKVYNNIVFKPFKNTEKDLNMWRGIVVPLNNVNVTDYDKNFINGILNYIYTVWAAKSDDVFDYILDWLYNVIFVGDLMDILVIVSDDSTHVTDVRILKWIVNHIIGINHSLICNYSKYVNNIDNSINKYKTLIALEGMLCDDVSSLSCTRDYENYIIADKRSKNVTCVPQYKDLKLPTVSDLNRDTANLFCMKLLQLREICNGAYHMGLNERFNNKVPYEPFIDYLRNEKLQLDWTDISRTIDCGRHDNIIIHSHKLCWDILSKRRLSYDIFREFKHKLNWDDLSEHSGFTEERIEEFIDKVNWDKISEHQELSEEFIDKHQDRVNWDKISEHQDLSEEFIDKHQDRVNWDKISEHQYLSEEFIDKHQGRVNWDKISEHQVLSEKFIEKHQDRVNWDKISEHQVLSEKFMNEHQDRINWNIKNHWKIYR